MNKRTFIALSVLIISSTPLYAVENGTWVMQTVDFQGMPMSTSLAIDSTGKPQIVYYDNVSQNIKVAVWNGTQWILSVIDTCDDGSPPHIVLDSYDNRHIVFTRRNGNTGNDKIVYHGPCSPIDISVSSFAESFGVDLDSVGNPHIGIDGKHIYFDGTAWVKETAFVVGYSPRIKIDSYNIPHIAYCASEQLAYAVYNPASWNWSYSIVDSTSGSGEHSDISLALDSNDKPHIAYGVWDPNFDLRYAKFDGISWSIQEVDTVGNVGWDVSLALDVNDHPHISYFDYTNGALKYAYYDGSLWHTEIVDARGDLTGRYTSLALDPAGYPCISYIDTFNQQLRYAHVVPDEPVTICTSPIQGDLNNDCKVDFADFALLVANWLQCNLDPPEACWE